MAWEPRPGVPSASGHLPAQGANTPFPFPKPRNGWVMNWMNWMNKDAAKVFSLNQPKNSEATDEREVKGGTASGEIIRSSDSNTLGSPFANQMETSRRQLGRQVWNLGARSEPKLMWESSGIVFIATRLAEGTPGGPVDGELPDWALGSLINNYRIIITIVLFLEVSGTVPGSVRVR